MFDIFFQLGERSRVIVPIQKRLCYQHDPETGRTISHRYEEHRKFGRVLPRLLHVPRQGGGGPKKNERPVLAAARLGGRQ